MTETFQKTHQWTTATDVPLPSPPSEDGDDGDDERESRAHDGESAYMFGLMHTSVPVRWAAPQRWRSERAP